MRGPIEFWFEFASNYSYLSVMRIEAAAGRLGVPIRWKPFLLGPIFRSLGWETSPFVLQKAKGDYVWMDMARECSKYGLPWLRPTIFPRPSVLAARVAFAGAEEEWIGAFCRRIMSLNFAEDREIDSPDTVRHVLDALHLPSEQIIDEALSQRNKLGLRRQTEAAAQRGVFGAPTFFAGSQMFWGNDRLDEALIECIRNDP